MTIVHRAGSTMGLVDTFSRIACAPISVQVSYTLADKKELYALNSKLLGILGLT
jgi:hypothetical protein